MRLTRVLAVTALAAAAGAITPNTDAAPAERYIVVLSNSTEDSRAVANEHSRNQGAEVGHVYTRALKGYAATIPPNRVDSIRSDPRVSYVEPDTTMSASAQTIPWGIAKIGATVSSALAGNGSGTVSAVRTYVIDTGVYSHADLNLVGHVNFAGGKNTDCNGHGTHVAGTMAAEDDSTYVVGVAPGAGVVGVKVLGCNGSGWTSNIIKGIDWVTANAVKPAVANMSLGGGASKALDDAVVRSAASGVLYSVAAGNEGTNACNSSPARAGAGVNNGVVTVGATDAADREASWSNYGSCVDIWAPGVSVLSTRKGGGTTTMSGTSMAAPHIGGGAALYLSMNPSASAAGIESAMKTAGQTPGTLSKSGLPILREHVGGF